MYKGVTYDKKSKVMNDFLILVYYEEINLTAKVGD